MQGTIFPSKIELTTTAAQKSRPGTSYNPKDSRPNGINGSHAPCSTSYVVAAMGCITSCLHRARAVRARKSLVQTIEKQWT